MSNLVLSLLFDFMLAILLIATIRYCSKLSQRIRILQDSRSELASMIGQFDRATERAMTSLAELQTVSKKITEALQLKIDKANFIADDMAFLIEKSTKLNAQMEKSKAAQAEPKSSTHQRFSPETKPFFEVVSPQPAKTKPLMFHNPPAETPAQRSTHSSLEAVLQRLAASSPMDSPSDMTQEITMPRTEAERELIEALKAGG